MKYGRLIGIATLLAMSLMMVLATGCRTMGEERPGDPTKLEAEARAFHTNMRWARWEHASDSVHISYVQEFMGRYEELGEDFSIVDLTLKSAEITDEGFAAILEVQQEWYELPSTTVESERFVERWVYEDGLWRMRERMTREEYRDLDSEFPSEVADRERREEEEAERIAAEEAAAEEAAEQGADEN